MQLVICEKRKHESAIFTNTFSHFAVETLANIALSSTAIVKYLSRFTTAKIPLITNVLTKYAIHSRLPANTCAFEIGEHLGAVAN